ncbi:hypothetical protein [Spiroplasma eriocheiris]|uniref:Uncharacterized protein n=1 Tax=Spiroplasma eriocheiris TaxID=315358 RepID=A0A0H3XLY0_9MOLU|nr:hypothetical protein [Spiroplasma eriocheiris]AHF57386.1 hypothetical protein SPE_0255 [Spiroplasma eriocheiris CCTCC M 207170]AKM53842.1 hypothetical protein SERIO_v1c02580 [Spiroplasma eriocheiris]
MSENNFWSNVETGMNNYLTKYLSLFKESYQKPEVYKDEKVDAFLKGLEGKEGFEQVFNYVRVEIKPLFDQIRTSYLTDKKPEEIEQNKINTLIEVSKLFNAIIPLPRFLNDFMVSAKESSPVDLNKLFVNMMKLEVNELTKIYDEEIKGMDPVIDNCVADLNKSEDALEIWNFINQFGLFLQRDMALTEYNQSEEDKKFDEQLKNIDKIEQDFKDGKIQLPEFNKERLVEEVNKYHSFVTEMTPETRKEVADKAINYRNKVLPLVQIVQCLHDLLINILTATNIINTDKQ